MIKFATWGAAAEGALYHWCPACAAMHPIPRSRWTRSGSDDLPTFEPSFGQYTERGYCHYKITAGQLVFQSDCFHSVRGTQPLPDIPAGDLENINGRWFVTTHSVFRR